MRIPSVDASADRFLTGLRRLDRLREQAQRQVASGRRLEAASDSPDDVPRLLQVRSEIARLEQTEKDLANATSETLAAEHALQTAAKLMDRVRTLGAQGASSFASAATRQGLAEEVGDILKRLVALANTESLGRYIFAGNNDQQAPYVWDETSTPKWGLYEGTDAARELSHPTGARMEIARDARWIFDSSDTSRSVFQQVQELYDALSTNDEARIQNVQGVLGQVTEHVNSALSFYGNVQNRLAEALATAQQMKLRIESARAGMEDADLAESILQLQQAQFQREAALQVRSQVQRRSLFDYLA
jgi:flagellar hook-associated protein 3 FlgL